MKVILLGIFSAFFILGQTAETELLSYLNKNLSVYKGGKYGYNMAISIFQTHDSKKPLEIMKINYQTWDNAYYLQQGNTETMLNQKYAVMVDYEEKEMYVQKIAKGALKNYNSLKMDFKQIIDLELMKEQGVKVYDAGESGDEIKFLAIYKNHESIDKAQYSFSKSSGLIKGLIIYYKTNMLTLFGLDIPGYTPNPEFSGKPRLQIVYNQFGEIHTLPKTKLDELNYFNLVKGKMVPTEKFKSYRLINLIK